MAWDYRYMYKYMYTCMYMYRVSHIIEIRGYRMALSDRRDAWPHPSPYLMHYEMCWGPQVSRMLSQPHTKPHPSCELSDNVLSRRHRIEQVSQLLWNCLESIGNKNTVRHELIFNHMYSEQGMFTSTKINNHVCWNRSHCCFVC